MRIVLTLLVRDEADILDAHLAYHLSAGVDFVIATDHRSQDGTTDILESYARGGAPPNRRGGRNTRGRVPGRRAWRVLPQPSTGPTGSSTATPTSSGGRAARSLKEALGPCRPVRGRPRSSRNFVPRRSADWFPDRLTVRLATSAPINDPATPFRPVVKAAHRGDQRSSSRGRQHQVYGVPGAFCATGTRSRCCIPASHPGAVRTQVLQDVVRLAGKPPRRSGASARSVSEEGDPDAIWDRVALEDSEVERGLADCSLVSDVRIRDAVRLVRNETVASRAIEGAAAADASRGGCPCARGRSVRGGGADPLSALG